MLKILNLKKNKWRIGLIFMFSAWLIAFELLRYNTPVMEFISKFITLPYKKFVGEVCNLAPFSVGEIICIIFGVFIIAYIIRSVLCAINAPKNAKLTAIFRSFLGLLVIALFAYSTLTALWRVNYYIESPINSLNVSTQPISKEKLYEVTLLFSEKLNSTATKVKRDENNLFSEDKAEIFNDGYSIYDNLEKQYPFLQGPKVKPKQMIFSRFMSQINYTGVFCPFTGEANLNAQQPLCFLPSTIAHELAHVRGVGPEQDCNFLAILACEASENITYEYSGWLLGYIHLSNSLYSADVELWKKVSSNLCSEVIADLEYNNEYWAQYESKVAHAANTVYDSFLQSNNQADGLKSYGRVTDLLLAWYGENS